MCTVALEEDFGSAVLNVVVLRPVFCIHNPVSLLFTVIYFFPSQETCESGCILPNSLSIRVLWARQGLLDLSQNYILGAKYLFQCQNVKVGTYYYTLSL